MSLDPLTAAFDIGNTLINKIWPDPEQASKAQLKIAELKQKGDLAELNAYVAGLTGQLSINKEEAKHPSIFVAGWRPFIGWVCGFSLLYAGLLEPFLRFVATMLEFTGKFPVIDTGVTTTILLGMLGIGAQRSYDKNKGKGTTGVSKK